MEAPELAQTRVSTSCSVWDFESGKLVRTLADHRNTLDPIVTDVSRVAVTPNGRQIISGYLDNAVW